MSSNSKVTTRRRTMLGLAGLAASASALKMAWGADPGPFAIKRGPGLRRHSEEVCQGAAGWTTFCDRKTKFWVLS
jgi:hypothetical protein